MTKGVLTTGVLVVEVAVLAVLATNTVGIGSGIETRRVVVSVTQPARRLKAPKQMNTSVIRPIEPETMIGGRMKVISFFIS